MILVGADHGMFHRLRRIAQFYQETKESRNGLGTLSEYRCGESGHPVTVVAAEEATIAGGVWLGLSLCKMR